MHVSIHMCIHMSIRTFIHMSMHMFRQMTNAAFKAYLNSMCAECLVRSRACTCTRMCTHAHGAHTPVTSFAMGEAHVCPCTPPHRRTLHGTQVIAGMCTHACMHACMHAHTHAPAPAPANAHTCTHVHTRAHCMHLHTHLRARQLDLSDLVPKEENRAKAKLNAVKPYQVTPTTSIVTMSVITTSIVTCQL